MMVPKKMMVSRDDDGGELKKVEADGSDDSLTERERK